MVPLLVYLVAGLITGVHLFVLLSSAILGGSFSGLEVLSLLGSVCLAATAYVALFRPYLAAKIALPSALVSWCFYGPSIRASLATVRPHNFADIRAEVLPYLAVISLALATGYAAVVSFRKKPVAETSTWLFPQTSGRFTRRAVLIGTVALAVGLGIWFRVSEKKSIRGSARFVLPAGYVGWVRVEFGVSGAPPVPVEDGQYVFRIPRSGLLKTSSPEQYGWGKDRYYYDTGRGYSSLPTGQRQDCLIWGLINGEEGGTSGKQPYQEFFVGTRQQFSEQTGVNRSQRLPVTAEQEGTH